MQLHCAATVMMGSMTRASHCGCIVGNVNGHIVIRVDFDIGVGALLVK